MSIINFFVLRKLFCIAIFVIVMQNNFAQNFVNLPNDTLIATAVFNDVNVFNITQKNLSTGLLVLKWKKIDVKAPKSWELSVCDIGHCYTELVDSSTMDPLIVGDDGLLSLHLNPLSEAGTGVLRLQIWDTATSNQIDTLTWIITAKANSGLKQTKLSHEFKINEDKNNASITINQELEQRFNVLIFNHSGSIVYQNIFYQKSSVINTEFFSNGIYVLSISNEFNKFNTQFFIQH